MSIMIVSEGEGNLKMTVSKSEIYIDHRVSLIYEKGAQGPIIICCGMKEQEVQADQIANQLEENLDAFLFIYYMAENWDDDYSPWKGTNPFNKAIFGGKAINTLQWMENGLLRLLETNYASWMENGKIFLAGYSLAGLFSLWTCFQCNLFSGIACCSGSLWYENMVDFVQENELTHDMRIYMSLGDREAKTKNPVLSLVDDCTGKIECLLKEKTINSGNVFFEWNKGGHFQGSSDRIVKGILWLLS